MKIHRRAAAATAFVIAASACPTLIAADEHGYPASNLLSAGTSIVGETIKYPADGAAQVTASIIAIPPGQRTITHRHGVPLFAYMLQGELTVDYGSRGKRIYRAGEAFMEAMDVEHFGANTGTEPVRILAVYIGAEGTRNVIPAR